MRTWQSPCQILRQVRVDVAMGGCGKQKYCSEVLLRSTAQKYCFAAAKFFALGKAEAEVRCNLNAWDGIAGSVS